MLPTASLLLLLTFTLARAGHLETLYTLDQVYTLYADHDDDVAWDEAEFKCPYYDAAHLPIIKDLQTDRDIAELTGPWRDWEVWIGLLDRYTPGYWFWNDGTKIDDYFTNWRSGEPNDKLGEGCGAYVTTTTDWNDKDCGTKLGFTCQKDRAKDATFYHTEYIIGGSATDQAYDGSLASARKRCNELGYRIAQISGNDALEKLKRNSNWDATVKYWVSGTKSCISLDEMRLNTGKCEGDIQYICEGIRPYNLRLSTYDQDYVEGDEIKIECIASGLPLPRVTWYKYNELVSEEPGMHSFQSATLGMSTLIIEGAHLEDSSRYRCVAVNSIDGSSAKAKTYIDIQVHPESMDRTVFKPGESRTLSLSPKAAISRNADRDIDDEECTASSTVFWMLPTIFALNVVILLALVMLICRGRPIPKNDPGQGHTNYAVYSMNGKSAGNA